MLAKFCDKHNFRPIYLDSATLYFSKHEHV